MNIQVPSSVDQRCQVRPTVCHQGPPPEMVKIIAVIVDCSFVAFVHPAFCSLCLSCLVGLAFGFEFTLKMPDDPTRLYFPSDVSISVCCEAGGLLGMLLAGLWGRILAGFLDGFIDCSFWLLVSLGLK